MSPTFVVRVATPADAPALAALAARTFTDTYSSAAGGASRPDDVAAYAGAHFAPVYQRAELADPALVTFVGEDASRGDETATDRLVGYAQLRLTPTRDAPTPPTIVGAAPREVARLYVERGWHGRGIADALMDAVQARATAAPGGADPLWLAVYQENRRALRFYARHGFATVGEATFWLGDERQRDWLMVWRARPA